MVLSMVLPALLTADGEPGKNMASLLHDNKLLVVTLAFKNTDNKRLDFEIDTVEGGVRATSVLFVLGFGIGLGSVILYKVYNKISACCQRHLQQLKHNSKAKDTTDGLPAADASSSSNTSTLRRRLVHSDTCDDILLTSQRPRPYHPSNEYLFHSHSVDLGESLSAIPSPGSGMFASDIGEDTFESMDKLLQELQNIESDVHGMDRTVKSLTPGNEQIRAEYDFHLFHQDSDWDDSPHNDSSRNGSRASSVVGGIGIDELNWDYHSDLVDATDMKFVAKRPHFQVVGIPEGITEEEITPVEELLNGHVIADIVLPPKVAAETQTDRISVPPSPMDMSPMDTAMSPSADFSTWQNNHCWQSLLQHSYNHGAHVDSLSKQKSEQHLDNMNGNNTDSSPATSPCKTGEKRPTGCLRIVHYLDKATHLSYEMRKGYQMLRPLLGSDSMYRVEGGVLQAALFSVLMHNAHGLYSNLVCALQRLQILLPKGYLENWDSKNNDNKNVGEMLLQCVVALFKKVDLLSSVKSPSERARVLQEGLPDELVEAVKVLMFTHQAAPLYCSHMDLHSFLKERVNGWTSSAILNEKELNLLGLSLGVQLELIWPAEYGETTFIRQYPQEVAEGVPKIRLVAESDHTVHVLCA